MAGSGSAKRELDSPSDKGNGLLLYHHHYSFYSQKVVLALHEKKLPFKSHIINVAKGEQYQPWFLYLNPRGEVPVLKDGVKVIPDSGRIIDYLEDNFSNGGTPRLVPYDQGPEIRQKVTKFRAALELIPVGALTMGSFLHPEFTQCPKPPFIQPVRMLLLSAEKSSSSNLRQLARVNPEGRELLLKKAESQDAKHTALQDKEEYKKILDQIQGVLKDIEDELQSHQGDHSDWWLCCNQFTVADIVLTILLDRLSRLGLGKYFWESGKKPCLEQYYIRVQQRDSYKATIPSLLQNIKMLCKMQTPLTVGAGIVITVTIIAGGFFIFRRK